MKLILGHKRARTDRPDTSLDKSVLGRSTNKAIFIVSVQPADNCDALTSPK